jgi:thiamine biosynthesis lipoprotein
MRSPSQPGARLADRAHRKRFEAIGTSWQIDTDRELTAAQWTSIHDRIENYDRTWSRFRADTLVSRAAAGAGTFDFGDDAVPLMSFYRRLYEVTGGAVTPLIGGTLDDLGYGAGYLLAPRDTIGATPAWDEVMTWDGPLLRTSAPVVLDIGAAGKGYLVDVIGDLIASFDVGSFVVDGSGDLSHRGPDALRVGMEHPADPNTVIGVIDLADRALAASASNRRRWGAGLHHIVDPRSGSAVRDVIASWVVADSGMVADGLATALFFTDPNTTHSLAAEFAADWAVVSATGSIHWSAGFPGEVFQ